MGCPLEIRRTEPLRESGNRGHEFRAVDRFGKVDLKSGASCFDAVIAARVGGQRGGWQSPHERIVMSSHLLDQLKAVDAWHSEVRYEHVRRFVVDYPQRVLGGGCRADACTRPFQQFRNQGHRVGIVVDRQHVDPAHVPNGPAPCRRAW